MEIVTEYDEKQNVRQHKITGSADTVSLIVALKKIYSDPDFRPDMGALWDFTYADFSNVGLDSIEEGANFIVSNLPDSSQYKVAVVAPRKLEQYLVQKLSKVLAPKTLLLIKIFNQKADALLWLKLSPTS